MNVFTPHDAPLMKIRKSVTYVSWFKRWKRFIEFTFELRRKLRVDADDVLESHVRSQNFFAGVEVRLINGGLTEQTGLHESQTL